MKNIEPLISWIYLTILTDSYIQIPLLMASYYMALSRDVSYILLLWPSISLRHPFWHMDGTT